MNIVLVTGGFDPIHSGHIDYMNKAKQLSDLLIVGLNSDEWLARKKGKPFMPYHERECVVRNMKCVDDVMSFDDSDNSASDAIRKVRALYPNATIVFANGGDRTQENIPEMNCGVDNVKFVFGVGGENKKNSSRWILENWKSSPQLTERPWGTYEILAEGDGFKVKRIKVLAGKRLSLQSHEKRKEHWTILSGSPLVTNDHATYIAYPQDTVVIGQGHKHRIQAMETDVVFIEVQTGTYFGEDDIVRYDDDFGRA